MLTFADEKPSQKFQQNHAYRYVTKETNRRYQLKSCANFLISKRYVNILESGK